MPRPAETDPSARRVDVDLDILVGIDRLEEEQLGLDDVGGIVVDRRPEEDDAVHHQPRKDIHRGDVQLALLDDRRRDIGRAHRLEIVQAERTDPAVFPCVFFKFRRHVVGVFCSKKGLCKHHACKVQRYGFFRNFYSAWAILAKSSEETAFSETLIFDLMSSTTFVS